MKLLQNFYSEKIHLHAWYWSGAKYKTKYCKVIEPPEKKKGAVQNNDKGIYNEIM